MVAFDLGCIFLGYGSEVCVSICCTVAGPLSRILISRGSFEGGR